MALKSKVHSAIKKMFSTLKDFQVSATYSKRGTDTFDPETGEVTSTNADYAVNGIALNYHEYIGSDKIGEKTDLAFVLLQSQLSVTPDTRDYLTVSGKVYNIISCEPDPAQATWSIQLRVS